MRPDLEKAIEVTRALPRELQEQAARLLLLNAGIDPTDDVPVPLTDDEEASLKVGLAAAERGDFATDDEMRALRAKYGR